MTTLDTARGPNDYFNPTREMPVNWVYSFALWLFLWFLAKCIFLIQFQFRHSYPASKAANILLLYSPLPTQLLGLIAIAAYATAIGNYRLNRALKWTNTTPISLRLGRFCLRPSSDITVALCVAVGFGLFLLQSFLCTSVGGPVTRADEFAAKFPQTVPYTAATAILIAPAAEELLYRGVLFTQAHGKLRKFLAVLISCSVFTLVHFAQYSSRAGQIHWGAISSIAALGLTCCLCRALLDRVWPSFVVHTSYNIFVAAAYFATK